MDFASLMSSAISKSKPAQSSETASTVSSPAKKYVRKAELETQRQEAYLAEQEAAREEREQKARRKREADSEEADRAAAREAKRIRLAEESRQRREQEAAQEESARRKRLGLPPAPPPDSESKDAPDGQQSGDAASADIDDEELRLKLRELKAPVTLYAETHVARLRRYRALIKPKPKLSTGPIPTVLELFTSEVDMQVPAKPPPADTPERGILYRQLASYFTLVLSEWDRALAGRAEEVIGSAQGRQAETAMLQSRENLRPLFRRFERGDLDDDILGPVVEIVRAAQDRRYVDANDGYLRLSIGKAAWPIGVTMIGIHERSARERLNESETKTHILSDEATRKYLQSIKRCLTFAQTRWPPEDHLQLMG